jgi:hypothetical protein
VYGEFVRTFTFNSLPSLPVVEKKQFVVFPEPTIEPENVRYVENADRVGLLVPRGVYRVFWQLNPSEGGQVSLIVNGETPELAGSPNYAFGTQQAATGSTMVEAEFLIKAKKKRNNLIALQNTGDDLFSLGNIPNTQLGDTALITHVRVVKIAELEK